MALLKLNRFHWHFADDEAFRLEVETQPLLWQRTAFRGEGELVPGVFGGGIRAVEDMRRFVEAGINAFDCADHYVGVEDTIGVFRRKYPELAKNLRVSTK
ncbi:MAG: aldo/keto reductase, partial [Pseudomonadota bacterium]